MSEPLTLIIAIAGLVAGILGNIRKSKCSNCMECQTNKKESNSNSNSNTSTNDNETEEKRSNEGLLCRKHEAFV